MLEGEICELSPLYIIHNADTVPAEKDRLMHWYTQNRIVGHFKAFFKLYNFTVQS